MDFFTWRVINERADRRYNLVHKLQQQLKVQTKGGRNPCRQSYSLQGVDFTNKDGERIVGMNIFVAFKDENVHGLKAEKFFLKEGIALPEQVKVNDTLEISFNYKGKIESITKA